MGVNGSCKFRLEYVRLNKGGFGLKQFLSSGKELIVLGLSVGLSVRSEFYGSCRLLLVPNYSYCFCFMMSEHFVVVFCISNCNNI